MKFSKNTTISRLRWWQLPVLLSFASQLPVSTTQAAPIQGECKANTDTVPRIALVSAFSGEADRFIDEMRLNDGQNKFDGCLNINGHRFSKGKLRGKNVVVVLTNISIVNATMVTQLTLDKFNVSKVIFSGIAGGVGGVGANDDDPNTPNETPIGSVTIPKRWAFPQETYFNNTAEIVPCAFSPGLQLNHVLQDPLEEAKTCNFLLGQASEPGQANPAGIFQPDAKNAFLRNTNVSSDRAPQFYFNQNNEQIIRQVPFPGASVNPETDQDLKFWFMVDEAMFKKASQLEVKLLDCPQVDQAGNCATTPIDPPPQLIVGQNGVAGPTFVDNAQYRRFLATTLNFDEQGNRNAETDVLVVDMETTASAMVAYSNNVPFIAVRSVSDLAGGGEEAAATQIGTFFAIAAENQARVVFALLEKL
ncbi:phosphorylase [Cyanosarcina cf. burmensis CCALA 770]|nr:phosphorylase [Cyanosarcina cf. burmensis CCALA 770]